MELLEQIETIIDKAKMADIVDGRFSSKSYAEKVLSVVHSYYAGFVGEDESLTSEQVRNALIYKQDISRGICDQCIEHLPKAQAVKSRLNENQKGYKAGVLTRQMHLNKAKKDERERIQKWGIRPCFEHGSGSGVFTRRECPECWKSLGESV
uniref:Uncharacterized protein n=1 Tax=viral metagenome TaxID=1070528 RepID=A0A6H1Z6Q8_9ZZZZ